MQINNYLHDVVKKNGVEPLAKVFNIGRKDFVKQQPSCSMIWARPVVNLVNNPKVRQYRDLVLGQTYRGTEKLGRVSIK
jgi:hypothetical protein